MLQRKTFMLMQTLKRWIIGHWPLLVSMVVPLVILGPLLAPGYILTYDMVFSPHVFFNFHTTLEGYSLLSALPTLLILKVASFILPMDLVQKIILASVFFLAIYGLYLALPLQSKIARLLAGLVYGLNPFVYDRLMAGHWELLLGYALTPFVLIAFLRVFRTPSRKTVAVAALAWAGVAIISSHHLLILGVLFIALAAAFARSQRSTLAVVMTIAGTFVLSSWWLIPLLTAPNITQAFSLSDLYVFTAQPSTTYGIWLTLASLQGFWFQGWQPLGHFFSAWPLLLAAWLVPALVGIGVIFGRDQNFDRRLILGISGSAVVSILLVAGPSAGFGQVTTWAFLHIPGLSGLREPQKLIGLLALLYAVCAAYGFAALANASRRILAVSTLGFGTIIIILMGWPLLYGASHQLVTSQYPDSWQQLSRKLEHNPDEHALVLPYELYIDKSFAGRLVADPARAYFSNHVITSNDPKLPGVQNFASPSDQSLNNAISTHNFEALRHALTVRHIRYVILIPSTSLSDYLWITTLPHSVFAHDDKSTILQLTTP